MRRVEHDAAGRLHLTDAAIPTPRPDELVVRVEAAGATLPMVRKLHPGMRPTPIGGEIGGPVTVTGRTVTGFQPGDRVTGLCFAHAYADYAVLNQAMATPIPDEASAADAVALIRGGAVAMGALDAATPRDGGTVLVTAAASGVGHLLVQLAVARGLTVVAAVGDRHAKRDFVTSCGATRVVEYGDVGGPYPLILDGCGGDVIPALLAALAPGGRLVAYGSGGGLIDASDLIAGGRTIIGFQIGRIARERPDRYRAIREELWRMWRAGTLKPAIHARVPLVEAARAHEIISGRANRGKVVLVP